MQTQAFFIECLKQDIERKYNRTCKSPSDFKLLTLMLKEEAEGLGESISESTLRRIWGYSKTDSVTRKSTLTVLARRLGFIDWDAYATHLVKESQVESDFLTVDSISASDFRVGDKVEVTWKPDRKVEMECVGAETFRIRSRSNSKLKEGDTFRALVFRKGTPLLCMDVKRGTTSLGNYIAGESNGLTSVTFIPLQKAKSKKTC